MFSPSELADMIETIVESLGTAAGLGASVVFLRGTQTLPAQDVRLVRPGGAGTVGGAGTEAAQAVSSLVGPPTLNVRARDRFVLDGLSYEVVAVLPQRQIATTAQVRSLQ